MPLHVDVDGEEPKKGPLDISTWKKIQSEHTDFTWIDAHIAFQWQ